MNNSRSTILLGAGAVIDIGAPTTNDITQEIIKQNKYINYLDKNFDGTFSPFTAVSKVYSRLKEKYPKEPNFEQVFHVLEMLESYNRVWSYDCVNSRMYPPLAPFVVPETNIISHSEWKGLSSLLSQCQIDIMKMINKYDEMYNVKKNSDYLWYRDFWNKINGFDLFNLNYDTTIEQSVRNYNDGFVDSGDKQFQRFDPKELFVDDGKNKICHLHGCILFNHQRYKDINHDVYEYQYNDMYKWNDYDNVEKMLQSSFGTNPSNQSGETLHVGSIITGLRKTDKVTFAPYNYYHHYLNTAILNNKSLLIVGYSFGDLYVNDLIERMNLLYGKDKRIVVVTYWPQDDDSFMNMDCESEKMNHNEFIFLKRMMHDDGFQCRFLDRTRKKEDPYISKDGDVALFVYGFKSAVKKYGDMIIDFLDF